MFESRKTQNFGNLDCAYSLAKNGSDKTIVLLHGYGADCWDLFPLKDYLDPKGQYNWYFPNGILSAEGLPNGRAWFPLDTDAIEAAMREGRHRDMSELKPAQFPSLVEKLSSMLTAIHAKPENVILGGFSQGSMLALETALATSFHFAGLVLLSSALLNKKELPLRAMEKPGQSFFQSHGVKDVLLPHHGAEALYMLLKKSGWQGSLHSFEGGHEIPLDIIEKCRDYINTRFKT
tara:strand:+ start:7139 stop:7840 length:702 start_codon:yes stop_codon:yes gene_type:complete